MSVKGTRRPASNRTTPRGYANHISGEGLEPISKMVSKITLRYWIIVIFQKPPLNVTPQKRTVSRRHNPLTPNLGYRQIIVGLLRTRRFRRRPPPAPRSGCAPPAGRCGRAPRSVATAPREGRPGERRKCGGDGTRPPRATSPPSTTPKPPPSIIRRFFVHRVALSLSLARARAHDNYYFARMRAQRPRGPNPRASPLCDSETRAQRE